MPASIFGDRFVGFKEPAWHGLGKVFTEKLTVSEAIELADVGFEIYKVPNYARVPVGDGLMNVETKSFSIMREPTTDSPEWTVLSTVGKEWTPIQITDLAKMLDPLSEQYGVETVGAIGQGEKVFITLDAGSSKIAGEDHNLFYLITDHRDGSGALSIAFTPVRVVCQNTLTLGLREAKLNVSLQHRKSIVEDAEWYTNIFNQMLTAKEDSIAKMNVLSTVKIDDVEAKKVVDKSYPTPSMPSRLRLSHGMKADDLPAAVWARVLNDKQEWERKHSQAIDNIQKHKDMALEKYDIFNQEFPNVAQTPWAIWQAVVETEDYRRGKGDGNTNAANGRQSAALFGTRASTKEKAFSEAYKLATA